MTEKFTSEHANQYKIISDDMRFYSDQQFKIVSVYLITNGLLVNVVKDHKSMVLAIIGITLSYSCFSWAVATSRWWGTLIEQAKALETLAVENGSMIELYKKYQTQNPPAGLQKLALLRPTSVTTMIYLIGIVGWALSLVPAWGYWW